MDVHPREETPFDASNETQVRQRNLAAKRREKADRDVLAGIMSSPDGRAWMWSVLSLCHIYGLSYDQDASVTAFREGERNIGLWFIQQINRTCPELLIKAMTERADG
jgi:hypothetical protein